MGLRPLPPRCGLRRAIRTSTLMSVTPPALPPRPAQPTLRRVARRAFLGLAIMVVAVSGAAWLWYATIDQDQEAREGGGAAIAAPVTVKR